LRKEIVSNNTSGNELHELFGLCTNAAIPDDHELIEQYNDTNNLPLKENLIDAV
jgi:hypothetical protein